MSLIKITKDGQELILYPGTKIKFFLKSPLFLYGPAPASRTLSFAVPAEPNDKLLQLARHPDRRNKTWTSTGWQIFLGGNYWKSASMLITKIRKTEYEIQLLIDKGYLATHADRSLRDFNYNKNGIPYRFMVTSLERDNFNFAINVDPPVYSITIELKVSAVTITTYVFTIALNEPILDFTARCATEINANFERDHFFAHTPSGSLEIGYIYGYAVFSTAFTESSADITAVRTQYISGALDNQNVYISKLVNEDLVDDMIYYGVKNPEYYGSDITVIPAFFRTEWRNPFFPQATPVSDWFLINQATANAVTPFPWLYNVLQLIHKEIGFNVDDQFFDDELKRLTIYSTFDQGTVYTTGGQDAFYISLFFKLKEAMPDITLSAFLSAISNMFCTIFDYNSYNLTSRWVPRKTILTWASDDDWTDLVDQHFEGENAAINPTLNYNFDSNDGVVSEFLKDIEKLYIKDPVNKVDDLPTSGNEYNEIRLVLAENKYYISKNGSSEKWVFFAEDLFESSGDDDDEIKTDASTLFSTIQDFTTIGGETYADIIALYPFAKQIGKSQFQESPNKEFALRLLFYRGLVKASKYNTAPGYDQYNDFDYPFGTYSNLDLNNNSVGNYSLKWNGSAGLKAKHWADWNTFLSQTEKYPWDTALTQTKLLALDQLKPKRIKNQEYFIDEIEVDIGDTIETAQVTTYKK